MHIHPQEKTYAIIATSIVSIFFVLVTVSSFAFGVQLPAPEMRVDPKLIATPGAVPGFGDPVAERVRELAPKKYEVYIVAQMWVWLPNKITVPVGSHVTFYVTSKDVQHGFMLEGSNVNMMILPGQVSKLSTTFDTPGTFNAICNEFCGNGHHTMFAQVIVTP